MKKVFNNKGISMPIVLIALVLTTIFGYALLFMVNNQSKFNSVDKQMKLALEYAEAGYNKYLWHLNDDANFYSIDPDNNSFGTDEDSIIAKKLLKGEKIEFQEGYHQVEGEKPSDSDRFVTIKSTGWTKQNPEIKKTIETKVRKKQFVHHVYVSDNDGENIWWTTGDESHGPYHTNGKLYIQNTPNFFDVVTYKDELKTGKTYTPKFYFKNENPNRPKKNDKNLPYIYKTTSLDFPKDNNDLKIWAEQDKMVFYGRTSIYLNEDKVVIRNKDINNGNPFPINLNDKKNKVIYVDNVDEKDDFKGVFDIYDKFNLNVGNIFISGELKGQLTIASKENIYITATDPTTDEKPSTIPETGGITYKSTNFSSNDDLRPSNDMSKFDSDKKIWTRYAVGQDMLGLVANHNIMILHYGWPKYEFDDPYWYDDNNSYDIGWYDKWNRWNNAIKKNRILQDFAPKNINIQAANFAVNGGFGYEAYDYRERQKNNWNNWVVKDNRKGNIDLWGNITQKTRLAVGTIGTTGYNKKYAHDPRMFYDYPPHILEPTNVGWEIHEWKETNDHLIEKP